MTKQPQPLRLVTFTTWANDVASSHPKQVSINPNEVSDVEDYCGTVRPGSVITLKNKKTYLVAGKHADIVNRLAATPKGAS